jgi:hypothetical protein
MKPLPDWLVERAALDEVPPASRTRLEAADPAELADRIAALRADNAAELTRHPAGPAVAQIAARVAATAQQRRRRRLRLLGLATTAAAAVVAVRLIAVPTALDDPRSAPQVDDRGLPPGGSAAEGRRGSIDDVRVKGAVRLMAFRQVGPEAEQLLPDAVVHAGDVIQLRYNTGGHGYGLIASVDGAGVVTLHFPLSEQAPAKATAVAQSTVTLPNAYALDDAPRFERFFLVTGDDPIDVQQTLASLRAFAHRDDSATAVLELPTGLRQWSLRLRKPDRSSPHHELP